MLKLDGEVRRLLFNCFQRKCGGHQFQWAEQREREERKNNETEEER